MKLAVSWIFSKAKAETRVFLFYNKLNICVTIPSAYQSVALSQVCCLYFPLVVPRFFHKPREQQILLFQNKLTTKLLQLTHMSNYAIFQSVTCIGYLQMFYYTN